MGIDEADINKAWADRAPDFFMKQEIISDNIVDDLHYFHESALKEFLPPLLNEVECRPGNIEFGAILSLVNLLTYISSNSIPTTGDELKDISRMAARKLLELLQEDRFPDLIEDPENKQFIEAKLRKALES